MYYDFLNSLNDTGEDDTDSSIGNIVQFNGSEQKRRRFDTGVMPSEVSKASQIIIIWRFSFKGIILSTFSSFFLLTRIDSFTVWPHASFSHSSNLQSIFSVCLKAV